VEPLAFLTEFSFAVIVFMSPLQYGTTTAHTDIRMEEASTSIPPAAIATTETAKDGQQEDEKKTVPITFVEADGTEKLVHAVVGRHLLDVAHDNNVELEGACGGELACSTCHLIFEPRIYDTLPPKKDDEDDMLDLAFKVTETCVVHWCCCLLLTFACRGDIHYP
jgi:ferredoxin-2, mitochondrial